MPESANLLTTLREAAADRLHAPFLIDPGDGTRSRTYGDAFDLAARLAAVIASRGVDPGDRVVATVAKSTDAVALYLACVHAGAVYVPLNPAFTDEEIAYFVADSEPALVVDDDALDDLVAQARRRSAVPVVGPAVRTGDDIAALLYTSGTTGRPKGAALTHAALRHNAQALHAAWRFGPDDRLLHTLPIFHVHGLFVALHCAMLSAIPVTFLARFGVDDVIAHLGDVTVLMGVPTHYRRMLDDPRLTSDTTRSIRLFTCGSAPLPDAVFVEFAARTGHRILERYGMSEAGIITSNPYDGDRIAGTVGHPLPGVELRVVDDTGAAVPSGTGGEVEIRGPHLFAGYWRRPDATVEAHTADGFFRTGDIGSLDGDGRLRLQGRTGDLIISGGENIYPKEIELVLDSVAGVVESAVFGVSHPDLGEAVTAVVVPTTEYDETAVTRALDAGLARFKHPKQVLTTDDLPRNTMGKIRRNALRERYEGLYDPGGEPAGA